MRILDLQACKYASRGNPRLAASYIICDKPVVLTVATYMSFKRAFLGLN